MTSWYDMRALMTSRWKPGVVNAREPCSRLPLLPGDWRW